MCGSKQRYSLLHDTLLFFGITRMTKGIAERQVRKEITGNTAVFDDVDRGTDDHGGNTVLFEVSRGQTHGLMADGSERHEQGNVCAVFP